MARSGYDVTKMSMPVAVVASALLGVAIFTWNVSGKVHSMEMDMATNYTEKDDFEKLEDSVEEIKEFMYMIGAELGVDRDE